MRFQKFQFLLKQNHCLVQRPHYGLVFCLIWTAIGCSTSAPVGDKNPQWQKFSKNPPAIQKAHIDTPMVVHVNQKNQLVTIRHGNSLPADYLLAYGPNLNFKAVLFMQPVRNSLLRTALILDGTVAIDDRIKVATDTERLQYQKKFPQQNHL